ncbi:DUF1707 SHOCT-like domain-containing protein [Pseudonocardia spinosispora]|uniref:DUF1707 SHOCT-like domain-containing protein n=1 Tax=Pseudonocardia spinosispora TaxID=103441 RepID=UPI0012EC4341|nr:DUF1707 domain-containing protein [Pseudonocardia spinosispora]
MSGDLDPTELRISDLDRERAVAALMTAMEQGRITPTEFSDRCDVAWAARTRAELLVVLSDLPGGPPPELAPLVLDVPFGQVRRTGEWLVPEIVRITGLGQRTTLDFTDAVIRRPEVLIEITAAMSATRVLLPFDAQVDTDGLELIAGSVRHRTVRATLPRERPRGLRRLLRGARDTESAPSIRFVLRGRAALCSVTLTRPRTGRRR